MIDQTGASTPARQAREPDHKQPASTLDCAIRIPFPIEEVRRQLALIFASPIVMKESFMYRKERTGRINGDDVEVGLVWRHRRRYIYRRYIYLVRGRLRADPPGTILEMTFTKPGKIGIKWCFYFLLSIIVISVGVGYRDGLRGMELLLATIFLLVVFGLMIALCYFFVSSMRRSAVKDVEAFLMNSMAGRAGGHHRL